MARTGLTVEAFRDWDTLPLEAQALGGNDAFSTPAWYRSVVSAAMAPGCRPRFDVVSRASEILAVFPMQEEAGSVSALTTPYTVLWSPLLRPGLGHGDLLAVGRALGKVWRRGALTRLDAIDAGASWLPPLLAGLRLSALLPLSFDHFGNWHRGVAGLGWAGYLASRPGALRSAVARRTRRLMQGEGAVFTLTDGVSGLEPALAAYDQVYAASWKQPEPFPSFNAALMRACAAGGGLRLGVLALNGTPIAAQFWLVHGHWAGVQKLAHDERRHSLAPGTVLTALMIRQLLERDGVTELDFGRGDDPYKQSWTGERRQRIGIILAVPWHPSGVIAAARHSIGMLRRYAHRNVLNRDFVSKIITWHKNSHDGAVVAFSEMKVRTMPFPYRSPTRLVTAAALGFLAAPAMVGLAHATPITDTVTFSPYGLPAPTGPVSGIDLTGDVGQTSVTANPGANSVSIVAASGGAIVQGSSNNNYAAPVTGGTAANPTYWSAPYLSTGGSPGTITLSFAQKQSYFGLLWGSIGSGDYLTFVDSSGNTIGSVTGTQAMQSAAGFNGNAGAQGFGGSQYTLINFSGGQFSNVILGQSGGPSFEAADFEYAGQNVAVPEPASMALLGVGLAGLYAVRRRKMAA